MTTLLVWLALVLLCLPLQSEGRVATTRTPTTTTEQDVEMATLPTTTARPTLGPLVPPGEMFDEDTDWPKWSTALQRLRWKLEDGLRSLRRQLMKCKDKKCIAQVRKAMTTLRYKFDLGRALLEQKKCKTSKCRRDAAKKVCAIKDSLWRSQGKKIRCGKKPVVKPTPCHLTCRVVSFKVCGAGTRSAREACRSNQYNQCLTFRGCKTKPKKATKKIAAAKFRRIEKIVKKIIKRALAKCGGSRLCRKKVLQKVRAFKQLVMKKILACKDVTCFKALFHHVKNELIPAFKKKLVAKVKRILAIIRKKKAALMAIHEGYGNIDEETLVQEAREEMSSCDGDDECLHGIRQAVRQIFEARIANIREERKLCEDRECRLRLHARVAELKHLRRHALRAENN